MKSIRIRGARQNNLKNISLEIPHGRITAITGVSGSGKSSLAFDTLYAEGQRRYVESLSTYTRQFLERVARPDVDEIHGILPAIAVPQSNPTKTSRSTVGTATEIYDLLRLLFSRVGVVHCASCDLPVTRGDVYSATQKVQSLAGLGTVLIGFDFVVRDKHSVISDLRSLGFARILVEGRLVELGDCSPSDLGQGDVVNVVVDRVSSSSNASRIMESIELAFSMSGKAEAWLVSSDGRVHRLYKGLKCPKCGTEYEEPSPLLFSFNSPYGACPACKGFGNNLEFEVDLIIPNKERTIEGDAIEPWSKPQFRYFKNWLLRVCKSKAIPTNVAFKRLSDQDKKTVLYGDGEFPGVMGFFENLRSKGYKPYARFFAKRYMAVKNCDVCNGTRLRPEALRVKLSGLNIAQLAAMDIVSARQFIENLRLDQRQMEIAADVLREIKSRLDYLIDVGLDYLTLDRQAKTLSGGEAQRINLASALGAGLTGTLYVLDEPTIGLHARDTERLLNVLRKLTQHGNTVVVVEHDRQIIQGSDYVVDLGPGAGDRGGEVVFKGTPDKLLRSKKSLTARYLRGELRVEYTPPSTSRPKEYITIRNASLHNLKGIDVKIPLYRLVCITGVSGSGKSTLVDDILYNAVKARGRLGSRLIGCDRVEGLEKIRDAVIVDQSPIGTTPRANPITFVKGFDAIRAIFASTPEARARGYTRSTFSFNLPEGRCGSCQGEGSVKIEMHFLADIYVPCEECQGKRYKKSILEVTYKGKSISDVLEMTVDQAIRFFSDQPAVLPPLYVLAEVGLGYIKLGQPANTLSGGEAQRLKIAREIAWGDSKGILYIMDEPTRGLHLHDIATLVKVLRRLVASGNTVVLIEHNLDVIRCADHIIDLGPEGGQKGGEIVAEGSPQDLIKSPRSHTGRLLSEILVTNRALDNEQHH